MKITKKELSIGVNFEHLACHQGRNAKIELYMEHGLYHVRAFAFDMEGRKVRVAWDSFYSLEEAKKRFYKFKKGWKESVVWEQAFNALEGQEIAF